MAARQLLRVEGWTDFEAAGGQRKWSLPARSLLQCGDVHEVGGEVSLDLEAPADDPSWGDIGRGDVLRTSYSDGEVEEFRVQRSAKDRGQEGSITRSIHATGVLDELRRGSPILGWPMANGMLLFHRKLAHLTPEQHMEAILAAVADDPDAPDFFQVGAVEPTDRIRVTYDWATPLQALRQVAQQAGAELSVSRQGTTAYLVNLYRRTNARDDVSPPLGVDLSGDGVADGWTVRETDSNVVTSYAIDRGGQKIDASSMAPDVEVGVFVRKPASPGEDWRWAFDLDTNPGHNAAATPRLAFVDVDGFVLDSVSLSPFEGDGTEFHPRVLRLADAPSGTVEVEAWCRVEQIDQGDLPVENDDQILAWFANSELARDHETPRIAVGRNLLRLRERTQDGEIANRVYGRGVKPTGEEASLANVAWEVTSPSLETGAEDELRGLDLLMPEDDALNGMFVQNVAGSMYEILDSTRERREIDGELREVAALQLSSAPTGTQKTLFLDHGFWIRRNASGDDLAWVPKPSVEPGRALTRLVESRDVPVLHNLADDPFMGLAGTSLPSSLSAVNGAGLVEETRRERTTYGERSVAVSAAAGGEGVLHTTDVHLTAASPNVSVQAWLWLVSGTVALELVDLTNGTTYPTASQDEDRPEISGRNRWIGLHIGLGATNLHDLGAESIGTRVIAVGGAAEFALDAVQVLNRPAAAEDFVRGHSGRRLWRLAAEEFTEHGAGDPPRQYDVEIVDLHRLDTETWPFDRIRAGTEVDLLDREQEIEARRRVQRVERDLLQEAVTDVEIIG